MNLNDFLSKLSPAGRARNAHLTGGLSNAQQKSDPGHEPVAETPRKTTDPVFRHVRLISYRSRPLDDQNLWEHYFVDALVQGGILYDDSPRFAKVETVQVVNPNSRGWVQIEITPWP